MRASDLTDVLVFIPAEAFMSVCSFYALFGLVYFILLINVFINLISVQTICILLVLSCIVQLILFGSSPSQLWPPLRLLWGFCPTLTISCLRGLVKCLQSLLHTRCREAETLWLRSSVSEHSGLCCCFVCCCDLQKEDTESMKYLYITRRSYSWCHCHKKK